MISNPAEPLSPDIKANPARVCVTLLAACYPRRSISCYQPSSSSSSSNSDRPARIFSLNEPANFEAVLRLAQPAHAAHSCICLPACLAGWPGLAWLFCWSQPGYWLCSIRRWREMRRMGRRKQRVYTPWLMYHYRKLYFRQSGWLQFYGQIEC